MDYENFKEQIVEEVKSGLYEKGFEVNVTTQHVDKLNDGYDAMTITPADSNIGMNINISQLYEQMENGGDFAEVSHMAVETAATHLEDVAAQVGGDFFILPSSIAIVAVTMSGYSTQVCAMTSENEGIDLCMEKISSYGADLSISSSGKASIYGSVKAKSGSTYVKVTLQQLSGKTWSSVKSWESSSTGSVAAVAESYSNPPNGGWVPKQTKAEAKFDQEICDVYYEAYKTAVQEQKASAQSSTTVSASIESTISDMESMIISWLNAYMKAEKRKRQKLLC